MSTSPRIGVVGAGAAATLTALSLANEAVVGRAEAEITLIDPSATDGGGVAYSTTDLRHRLNVPADRMSALVDDPEHFLRWVRRHVAPEAVGWDYLPGPGTAAISPTPWRKRPPSHPRASGAAGTPPLPPTRPGRMFA